MPFTESTPLHKQGRMLFFKESFKHAKYGAVIQMTEILKAVLKRTQTNNLTISIKYTISDIVIKSSTRNKTWLRAAICSLLNISFAPLRMPKRDAEQ